MRANERKQAQEAFLQAYANGASVRKAAEIAGVARATVYRWEKTDAMFKEFFADAYDAGNDLIDDELFRRGITGWLEPMVSMGNLVYEYEPDLDEDGNQKYGSNGKPLMKRGKPVMVQKHSDSLATLVAKSRMAKYRDKSQVDLNANVNSHVTQSGSLTLNMREMTDRELELAKELARSMKSRTEEKQQ